jgi:hypothetical protein
MPHGRLVAATLMCVDVTSESDPNTDITIIDLGDPLEGVGCLSALATSFMTLRL